MSFSLPRDPARQTCAEGQRSASTHSPHLGRRAMQVRRPWNISRCDSSAQSRCGKRVMRSRSMRSGSVFRDSRSRRGQPGHVGVDGDALVDAEGVAQNDVSRLSPDAGKHPEVPPWNRESRPPCRSTTAFAMPMRLFVLLRKNPVDRMISSTSSGRAAGERFRVGIAPEELRRHQVDPRVGALGREDRGAQQLERVAVIELAVRVGVALLQPLEDFLRARLQRDLRFPSARAASRASAASLRGEREEVVEVARVEHVVRPESALPRDADAEVHVADARRCCARPRRSRACAPAAFTAGQHAPVEVEPVRVGVDLERHAALGGPARSPRPCRAGTGRATAAGGPSDGRGW